MKNLIKNSLLLAGLAAVAGGSAQAQVVVYDNTVNKLGSAYTSTSEFGDEIWLGRTERILSSFAYSYTGTGFDGDETVTFRIYANNGAPRLDTDPPAFEPGTLLFSSTDALPGTTAQGASLTYDLTAGLPVVSPEIITWTVSFGGIEVGEEAMLNIYNPPDIGQNPADFWVNDGSGWVLSQINGGAVPANFGALVMAVPEPSTVALGLMALGALGLAFRRKQ